MKLLIACLILSFSAFGQTNFNSDSANLTKSNCTHETMRIGLLQLDTGLNYLTTFNDCKPVESDKIIYDDLLFEKIDSVLKAAVVKHNQELRSKKNLIINDTIDLNKYSRQYMSAVSEKRGRLVWVNCFCTATGASIWPKLVIVPTGGDCYFNLLIQIDENSYSGLKFNAED